MSATDEVRRAAARLRKAAQLKKDELRNTHTQLGRVKDDHERLMVTLRQEHEAIQRSQNERNDRNNRALPQLKVRVGEVARQMSDLTSNHQREISELEQQINQIDREITEFENHAADLERLT